jgi:hypothetical protein
MSRVLGLLAVALAISLIGCGGGGAGDSDGAGDDAAANPSASTPTSPVASSPDSVPTAVDAAGDLSEFACAPGKNGVWNASGVLTNSTRRAADYRVTVVVAEGPGVSAPGKQRTLTALAPATPAPFALRRVFAGGAADATCQVEVLRLP